MRLIVGAGEKSVKRFIILVTATSSRSFRRFYFNNNARNKIFYYLAIAY
ncbi:hypothetical protein PAMC26510_21390 [Caballeronia sordidicola]|uniref:Uncharacterized protein n=1 Tax=Caballeronia sordidicola TaxID=196367 RepID=A0A242MMA4_CABSO|nr:hypothetical protein PAMC26510_21390 [Caballeronia sordidicola]